MTRPHNSRATAAVAIAAAAVFSLREVVRTQLPNNFLKLGVKSKNMGVKTHSIEGENPQEMKTPSWEMKTSTSQGGKKLSIEGEKIPGQLDQLQQDLFKPLVVGFLRALDFNAQYVPSALKGSL